MLPPSRIRAQARDASRARRARETPRPRQTPRTLPSRANARRPLPERSIVLGLLAFHLLLLGWVASRNSVTFDESFHLPAGVRILTRGDFATSYAQPPLVKTLCAAPVLLAGAHLPADSSAGPGGERWVGESFMRRNAARFHTLYLLGRMPVMLLSLLLGWMVWRTARRWYGPRAGLLALACYAVLPETLAHGSLVGVDLPTGLTFFGATLSFAAFARTGSWKRWWAAAAWAGAAFLTRFSAAQLFVIFPLLLIAFAAAGRLRRPGVAWLGLALLAPTALLVLDAGYLFQGVGRPLASIELHSSALLGVQHAFGKLPSPLPEAYLRGADYITDLAKPGGKPSFVLGQVRLDHVWWYFPLAVAVKWPLGFLGLIGARAVMIRGGRSRTRAREATLLVPVAVVFGLSMAANLDFGVRYLFPVLPFLCVWVSALARGAAPAASPRGARDPGARTSARASGGPRVTLAAALLAAIALETARALPYPLSFFNTFAGGPGRGDRIVNDSNVDWGQGLIALRDELRRRGIGRIHLAYHGTVDPAVYGIEYVPYAGGVAGTESDWFAVSSYFLVGLPARLTTSRGQSKESVAYELGPLLTTTPAARPAGSMYLFKVR